MYADLAGIASAAGFEFTALANLNDEELDALLEGYILGYLELPADSPDWIKELFDFS